MMSPRIRADDRLGEGRDLVSSGADRAGGPCSPLLPQLVLERGGVIDARKRLIVRNGDAQERAQRLPPLLYVKDQQPVGANCLLYCLIVLGKNGLAMRAIGEATAKRAGRDDVSGHCW